MKKYFDFKFQIKNNIPKIKITVKSEFLKGKAIGKTNMPISTSSIDYFIFHFGEEKASEIYNFYKKFFNKENLFSFYLKEFSVSDFDQKLIRDYLQILNQKMKENHKKAISSPEYKKKLSESYNRELHSKLKKERYKDPVFKMKMYEIMHNPLTKSKRINSFKKWLNNGGKEKLKIACNKPERIKKISEHSKFLWKTNKFSLNVPKNYIVNDVKMNKIEYIVANILNDLRINWVYEQNIFDLENSFFPDFILNNCKQIIECYGDYWHANPKFYLNENEIIKRDLTVKQIREKDASRQQQLENLGYEILILWEDEIINRKENTTEKIKDFVNGKKI